MIGALSLCGAPIARAGQFDSWLFYFPKENMSETIHRMSIEEFRESGYLQELNRQFLHPLGLALEVIMEDGEYRLGGIWDYRTDPEGILFQDLSDEDSLRNFQTVADQAAKLATFRQENFGWIVQPIGSKMPADPLIGTR